LITWNLKQRAIRAKDDKYARVVCTHQKTIRESFTYFDFNVAYAVYWFNMLSKRLKSSDNRITQHSQSQLQQTATSNIFTQCINVKLIEINVVRAVLNWSSRWHIQLMFAFTFSGSQYKTKRLRILSRILVTRKEINGFRIWWSVYWMIWLQLQLLSSPDWVFFPLALIPSVIFCSQLCLTESSVCWFFFCSWVQSRVFIILFSWSPVESESYVTTDGQSASLSWRKAPIWGLRPDFYYCPTVADLLMWGALSDEKTGLSFTIADGARQRSHSRALSQIRDFPLRRLLRLARLRWRYSTPPSHGGLGDTLFKDSVSRFRCDGS
jgi:hypothetical protein